MAYHAAGPKKRGPMNVKVMAVLLFGISVFFGSTAAAQHAEDVEASEFYVAVVPFRNTTGVFVVVDKDFFAQDAQTQQEWYEEIRKCAGESRLRGSVIAVANVKRKFRFYGPKSWHTFLRTVNMEWVSERVNKELTCYF
jgi:hypothetical protein